MSGIRFTGTRGPNSRSLKERLEQWSMPITECGCYIWLGAVDSSNYGILCYEGKSRKAHRLAWIASQGNIPKGMHVLHRCDNTFCINPDHLFLGSHADNMADMVRKERSPRSAGELNPRTTLTDANIWIIRSSSKSVAILAKTFGVKPYVVRRILSRKTWRHL